jgi:hypothetical protein
MAVLLGAFIAEGIVLAGLGMVAVWFIVLAGRVLWKL